MSERLLQILIVSILYSKAPALSRNGKLLNVLNIVRFPNDACTSGATSGVCYTASECTSLGGTSSGSCASGFGVCCLFSGGCGESTSINNTYFKSSSSDSSPCTFTVCKCRSDICQMRLNFDTFQTAQPFTASPTTDGAANPIAHSKGQCQNSQFQVYSDGPSPPTICGTNTGQHMIVEAADICNTLTFSWTTTDTRSWDIQVMQIPCTAEWKPPEGCLQYFTGTTGTIQSYNNAGGFHLANQKYSNCIRTELGYCSIAYSAVITASDFSLSGPAAAPTALLSATSCSMDYILISQGGTDATTANIVGDRFCGGMLSGIAAGAGATVYSAVQPFIVIVVTDGQEVDVGSGGAVEESSGFN